MLEGLAVLGMVTVPILLMFLSVPIIVKIRDKTKNPPLSVEDKIDKAIDKAQDELNKVNRYIESI